MGKAAPKPKAKFSFVVRGSAAPATAAPAALPARAKAGGSKGAAGGKGAAKAAPAALPSSSKAGGKGTPGSAGSPLRSSPPASRGLPPVSSTALVVFDDGSAAADEAQSHALQLAINHSAPDLAAGAAVFGVGLLALPFLAKLNNLALHESNSIGLSDEDAMFCYESHVRRCAKKLRTCDIEKRDLKKRFGELDVAFIAKEIAREGDELKEHVKKVGEQAAEGEASQIQQWRDKANSQLALLKKRSAFSFLGLPPGADESEVQRRYKKMALELHPDKGGDHIKFKELQSMRGRLMPKKQDEETGADGATGASDVESEDDDEESDDWEESETLEERQKRRKERRQKRKEKEEQERKEAGVYPWRRDMKEALVRLWEGARASFKEIENGSVSGSTSPALNLLRSFVDKFVSSELENRKGKLSEADVEILFNRFVKKGVEIIPVAAVVDSEATMSALAMGFNVHLLKRSNAAGTRARCAALLEAALGVPAAVRKLLGAVCETCARRQAQLELEKAQAEAAAKAELEKKEAEEAAARAELEKKEAEEAAAREEKARNDEEARKLVEALLGVDGSLPLDDDDSTLPVDNSSIAVDDDETLLAGGEEPGAQPGAKRRRVTLDWRDKGHDASALAASSKIELPCKAPRGKAVFPFKCSKGKADQENVPQNLDAARQGKERFSGKNLKIPTAQAKPLGPPVTHAPQQEAAPPLRRATRAFVVRGSGVPQSLGPSDVPSPKPKVAPKGKGLQCAKFEAKLRPGARAEPEISKEDQKRMKRTERLLERLEEREMRKAAKKTMKEQEKLDKFAQKWVNRKRPQMEK